MSSSSARCSGGGARKGEDDALSERFCGAFRAGLRYARASRELHVVLVRAAVFFACASAVWALLPLVARNLLGGTAPASTACCSARSVPARSAAPCCCHACALRLDADGLLLLAAVANRRGYGGADAGPAAMGGAPVMLLLLGAGLDHRADHAERRRPRPMLPNWVRGRALAVYLTVFNGAMTAGSLGWGAVAEAARHQRDAADRRCRRAAGRGAHLPPDASCRRGRRTWRRPTTGRSRSPAAAGRERPRPGADH
jgi:hypothetical protein